MFNQQISGKHKRCPNRLCKANFFKESFRGHQPRTATSIDVIMQCPACGDTFAITQEIVIVSEYMNELPSRPKNNKLKEKNITADEQIKFKKAMEEQNILASLSDENKISD